MNIYFAGSIRGGRNDAEFYLAIIHLLQKYGTVLTEHVGNTTLSTRGEGDSTEEYIYTRDMEWLAKADVIVAEVTTPSLGVGYEIGWAEGKKPILCLFRNGGERKLSAMIRGNTKLRVETYTALADIESILVRFFKSLQY